MGMINVSVRGSFGSDSYESQYSAEEGGHTLAVWRAVDDLLSILPHCIQKDHALAQEGEKPPRSDFGEVPK